jgi:hypothetical protein
MFPHRTNLGSNYSEEIEGRPKDKCNAEIARELFDMPSLTINDDPFVGQRVGTFIALAVGRARRRKRS